MDREQALIDERRREAYLPEWLRDAAVLCPISMAHVRMYIRGERSREQMMEDLARAMYRYKEDYFRALMDIKIGRPEILQLCPACPRKRTK